jgi:hypothetical protein
MTESRQSRSLLGRITPCAPDVVPRAHQVHERRSTSPPARRRSGSPRPHLRPDFTWATLRPDGEQDKSSRRLEDCDQPHNGCISIDSRGRHPMASGVSCKGNARLAASATELFLIVNVRVHDLLQVARTSSIGENRRGLSKMYFRCLSVDRQVGLNQVRDHPVFEGRNDSSSGYRPLHTGVCDHRQPDRTRTSLTMPSPHASLLRSLRDGLRATVDPAATSRSLAGAEGWRGSRPSFSLAAS